MARVLSDGRHTGDFLGAPATGRTREGNEGVAIFRFADGVIVDGWSIFNCALCLLLGYILPSIGAQGRVIGKSLRSIKSFSIPWHGADGEYEQEITQAIVFLCADRQTL